MAVTQYIGARYVPILADPVNWSSEYSYEPLTIVLYQGNSYTSTQYVPAGVDIANENFWKQTGNYNAQVEQYRQDTASYRNEVATWGDRITTVETNITAVETNVTTSLEQTRNDVNTSLEQTKSDMNISLEENKEYLENKITTVQDTLRDETFDQVSAEKNRALAVEETLQTEKTKARASFSPHMIDYTHRPIIGCIALTQEVPGNQNNFHRYTIDTTLLRTGGLLAGYEPIALCGFDSDGTVEFRGCDIRPYLGGPTGPVIHVRNSSSSSATVTVYCMCIKKSFLASDRSDMDVVGG